ncbi:hypothetical protein [Burkholderia sp. Se-20373]|uniref:hypothetical protein n=1 Tax=Burkholderia sp. Se-20373 TaxID=2703898 RepID=UPI0019809725|nr:hypothetical protein [Burkholderia sp. Se-20373]
MKRGWDRVRLRFKNQASDGPVGGDEFRTSTGRRYQVDAACLVRTVDWCDDPSVASVCLGEATLKRKTLMKKIKAFGMDLLGAVGMLGDWFSLAVTAGLVAALVLLGILTHHVGMRDGLYNYAVAMLVSASIVAVSVGAAKLGSRPQ